jgi:methyl-accepting chemotaxis protein
MEELARTSVAIAETVDRVAKQAAETRENLEQAERDIETSSERTLALANRVNDVEVLLGLINEIADQTNLLALNAAIEAARAGESGRGFTVVADEVRRLAERSKSSAADIAGIIQNTQAETNATVMAMEKGAKQMQRGLVLLDEVAVATDQVRLTTQQQRSATEQVVESMQQLSETSRQISTTAEQLAHAAADLAGLSATLERSSATDTVG